MIGDTLKDMKIRWAVQQIAGELTQAALATMDIEFEDDLEELRARLVRAVERAEHREGDGHGQRSDGGMF